MREERSALDESRTELAKIAHPGRAPQRRASAALWIDRIYSLLFDAFLA